MSTTRRDPSWWTNETTSGWERAKEALRRDWEQTKADFSNKGQELNQDAGDTVKQALGKEAIPPRGVPNDDWSSVEPGLRYGYGASTHHGDSDWDDKLEGKLREEWNDLKTGRTWDEVKGSVRRGYESARRKVKAA